MLARVRGCKKEKRQGLGGSTTLLVVPISTVHKNDKAKSQDKQREKPVNIRGGPIEASCFPFAFIQVFC